MLRRDHTLEEVTCHVIKAGPPRVARSGAAAPAAWQQPQNTGGGTAAALAALAGLRHKLGGVRRKLQGGRQAHGLCPNHTTFFNSQPIRSCTMEQCGQCAPRRLAQGGAPAAAFQALPRLRRPTLQARLQTLFQPRHPGHQLDVTLRPLSCSWLLDWP